LAQRPETKRGFAVDLALLPDVFALSVFVLAFRPLARRAAVHCNICFVGWTFLLIHSIALVFRAPTGILHTFTALVALWAVDLCGLSFLLVCSVTPARAVGRVVMLEMGLPILLQSTLFVIGSPWPLVHFAVGALYFVPSLDLLIFRRRRSRALVVVSLAYAVCAALLLPFSWRIPGIMVSGTLSMLFLCSAYLLIHSTKRWNMGVIASVIGLTAWGLTYPTLALLAHNYPEFHPQHVLVALPQYLLAAGMMFTLLEEHLHRTERMAMHDPLTDLPNRRLFEERLIATMEDARINRTTVACLVIDVDNFKTINDTLGHNAGDQLLRALAMRLSWHMSPRDILARTGGDEFTALLAGVNDEHHLRFIAGAMMSAASVPISIDGNPVDVHISVGIALSPDDADDIDSLRRAADEAMYSAKRRGGSLLAFAGKD
jgi:diguanylate cyclase (GGDEF)-like protein